MVFFDGAYVRLYAVLIQKCTLSNNRYGVLFKLHRHTGLMNYRVIVVDSTIANNTKGGGGGGVNFTLEVALAHIETGTLNYRLQEIK